MDGVAVAARILLVLVFATAAVGKLVDPKGARQALRDFRVPERFVVPFGWLLPVAELVVAVGLLIQPLARIAAIGAAILLVLFMAGMVAAMNRGEAPDCNCFGQIGSAPVGRGTLIRNAVLTVVALFVAVYGPGTDPGTWVSSNTAAEVVLLILGVAVIGLGAAVAGLWAERAKLRADLERAMTSLAAFPPGLPVGADAPAFALPTAAGPVVSLQDLMSRGRAIAMLFVSPTCWPCRHMFPDIARWQRTLSDRLTIAILASGPADDIASMADEFGLQDVFVQKESEVFDAYRAAGTPSMVIVNRDGHIATQIRSTQGVVEAAIRAALENPPPALAPEPAAPDSSPAEPDGAALDVTRWSGRGAQPV
jgi:uncharacterized membrane protein YphA (DoxX/SURF4 family)